MTWDQNCSSLRICLNSYAHECLLPPQNCVFSCLPPLAPILRSYLSSLFLGMDLCLLCLGESLPPIAKISLLFPPPFSIRSSLLPVPSLFVFQLIGRNGPNALLGNVESLEDVITLHEQFAQVGIFSLSIHWGTMVLLKECHPLSRWFKLLRTWTKKVVMWTDLHGSLVKANTKSKDGSARYYYDFETSFDKEEDILDKKSGCRIWGAKKIRLLENRSMSPKRISFAWKPSEGRLGALSSVSMHASESNNTLLKKQTTPTNFKRRPILLSQEEPTPIHQSSHIFFLSPFRVSPV
ncbi:hypothetical protein VNO77_44050 [Canavalia gladiata]|uniref:Uncharacterized protein n=1 Tax=Canavalia gladiata TaxID=3824 RepID=A0AAN9JYX6_CANGL